MKVFAPQQPSRYDKDLKVWVPTQDLSPALKFGELVIILPPGYHKVTQQIADMIDDILGDYVDGEDAILSTGDPTILGAVCGYVALKTNGKMRMLQWDKREREYNLAEFQI